MWTRQDLKTQAKSFLKEHYWKAFVVCLIVAIVTGGSGSSESSSGHNNGMFVNERQYVVEMKPGNDIFNFSTRGIGLDSPFVYRTSVGVFAGLVLVMVAVAIIIGNALKIGEKRFFLRAFEDDVRIGNLFTTFKRGQWLPLAGKMLLLDIYLILWTLLLIIPGIVKYCQYRMVPYILSENPNMPLSEAIDRSTMMTDGQKGDIFILDLSFIGWYLLGSLFFGIGGVFVKPYHEATVAKLFDHYQGGGHQDAPKDEAYI